MFALDFIMPGLGRLTSAFGKALTTALKWGLKIYNKVASVVSSMQLAGMALQGQWKDFFTSVGLGILGGMVSQLTSAIKNGVKNALWDTKNKFDELGDLFAGAWKGLNDGWKKLKGTIKHAFDNFPKNLIPWYGNYCSPAATGSNAENTGISGTDEKGCRPHDIEYGREADSITDLESKMGITNKNGIRWKADWNFVRTMVFGFGDPSVTSFDIAFSGQYGGRPLIGSVYKFFAVPVFIVSGTVRGFRKK